MNSCPLKTLPSPLSVSVIGTLPPDPIPFSGNLLYERDVLPNEVLHLIQGIVTQHNQVRLIPFELPIPDRYVCLHGLLKTRFKARRPAFSSAIPARRPFGGHRITNRDGIALPNCHAIFVYFNVALSN